MGFAETNSTFTLRGFTAGIRPHVAGEASTSSTTAAYASSVTRTLRNPGLATSAEAISPAPAAPRSWAAMASAMSSGLRRSGRASFIARFVAKSPNVALAGRSISMAGTAAPSSRTGSAPAATASDQARATATLTRARIAGAGAGLADWAELDTGVSSGCVRERWAAIVPVWRAGPARSPMRCVLAPRM